MGNQQLRPKGKVQRLSPLRRVGRKPYRNGALVVTIQNDYDEDIVCSRVKARGGISLNRV
nr:MAG TPA: hypothetical protein [Caudoviricetes sp.]